MVLPSVNTAEAEHPTSLVIEEGVEQHPEAPWASRKRFQTTTRCISKKSSNTNAFWEANTPPRWGLQASDLHHDGAFMWLDETCSWPHHSADQQLQLQMMSLNLSSVHDLQPQHAFQLRGRKAMHFSHMVLHGFVPVASVTQSELWTQKAQKAWCFQHAIIVAIKFQEGNKLLLITWRECVPMADFGSSQGKFSETPKDWWMYQWDCWEALFWIDV